MKEWRIYAKTTVEKIQILLNKEEEKIITEDESKLLTLLTLNILIFESVEQIQNEVEQDIYWDEIKGEALAVYEEIEKIKV